MTSASPSKLYALLALVAILALVAAALAACRSTAVPTAPAKPTPVRSKPMPVRSQPAAPVAQVDCSPIVHGNIGLRPGFMDSFESIYAEPTFQWSIEHDACIEQAWLTGKVSLHDINDAALLSALLKRAAGVTELRVVPLNDKHLKLIGALAKLERLVIERADVSSFGTLLYVARRARTQRFTSAGFDHLGALVTLRELRFAVAMSDATLRHTASLTGLKKLGFRVANKNDFTAAGAANIAKAEKLTGLAIGAEPDCKENPDCFDGLTDEVLAVLAKLDRLEAFGMSLSRRITDVGLVSLGKLTKLDLRILDLSGTQVWGEGLAALAVFSGLVQVDLSDSRLDDAGLASVAALKSLSDLNVSGTQITDAGLGALAKMDTIAALNLSSTSVGEAGMAHVAKLIGLTRLNLRSTETNDRGVAKLAALRDLYSLDISATLITDRGAKRLGRFKKLVTLSLSETRVGNRGMTGVGSLGHLKYLDLRSTQVGNKGLAAIASNPTLTVLRISDTQVNDEGLRKLNPALRVLQVGVGQFSSSAIKTLEVDRKLRVNVVN